MPVMLADRGKAVRAGDGALASILWCSRRERRSWVRLWPAYSPELNPAEHLWDWLREDCFANHVFADLDAVEQALSAGLTTLEANPTRTRSTTGFSRITSTSSKVFERKLV